MMVHELRIQITTYKCTIILEEAREELYNMLSVRYHVININVARVYYDLMAMSVRNLRRSNLMLH